MNLRALANGYIQNVNPNIDAVWQQSTGWTTGTDFKRTPTFSNTNIKIQAQGVSASDLRHLDGLNIQGVLRSVTMYGNVQGVVRADQQGGDILQFPEIPGQANKNWRVVQVMETWPEWSRVIVVMQS